MTWYQITFLRLLGEFFCPSKYSTLDDAILDAKEALLVDSSIDEVRIYEISDVRTLLKKISR